MISTGSSDLDEFIDGYKEEITTIYGEPSSGKTTYCLLAAINLAKTDRVIYIDTEGGFSTERIKQLCESNSSILNNIFLLRITNFKNQEEKIKNLINIIDMFSLVIVDTIGAHYRAELKKDVNGVNKSMDTQLKILAEVTRKGVPVIITNQVYTNINTNKICIVGGNMLKNWSKCLIRLEKNPRKCIVEKPINKEMFFEIKGKGIFKT